MNKTTKYCEKTQLGRPRYLFCNQQFKLFKLNLSHFLKTGGGANNISRVLCPGGLKSINFFLTSLAFII